MSANVDDFWRVDRHDDGIVWCTRSARPYLSVSMLDEVLVRLNRLLEPVPRGELALLLDLRRSPVSSQGEWTSGALLHHRKRLVRDFRRAGFLVARPEQGDPIPRPTGPGAPEVLVFRDEARARGALRVGRRPPSAALG